MNLKRNFALVIFILITTIQLYCSDSSNPVITETPDPGPTFSEKLQSTIDSVLVELPDYKGVSAAVKIPGEELWLGASGFSDPDNSEEITTDMLFSANHLHKSFVAALILKYSEEGLLSLEDPISNWITGYQYIDSTITVRHLLDNTSGLYDYSQHPANPMWNYWTTNLSREWTTEQILTQFIDTPMSAPGEMWNYSSTNYYLLQLIIEAISGTNRADEFRERFYTPLGLQNTYIEHYETIPANKEIADGWYWYGLDNLANMSIMPRTAVSSMYGGSLYTTAEDLIIWTQALLGGQVLNQSSLEEITSFPYIDDDGEPRGMHLKRIMVEGIEVWYRDSWAFGNRTMIGYLPDHNSYVVVLCNFNGGDVELYIATALFHTIMDEVLSK